MASLDSLALLIPCAYCGAKPGERCVRRRIVCRGMSRAAAIKHYGPTGAAAYLHTARTRPVWTIWADGRDVGAEYGGARG